MKKCMICDKEMDKGLIAMGRKICSKKCRKKHDCSKANKKRYKRFLERQEAILYSFGSNFNNESNRQNSY